MKSSTMVVSSTDRIELGSTISIGVDEYRWWVKFWYWITFRRAPRRPQYFEVAGISGPTMMEILPK